jgi:hypothetical protein
MSTNPGRSGGRHQGRGGGRGAGGIKRKTTKTSTPSQTKEMKFHPQTLGKGNYGTYASVKDAIVQYIQKNYVDGGFDVAKSIDEMKKVDLDKQEPVREIAKDKDDDTCKIKQDGLNIKYQEELRRFLARAEALEKGLHRAYAHILANYCTKLMQQRIEEHPDFEDKLKNDPIATLEAIKTLMHDSVLAQYPLVSVTDAFQRFINIKQVEGEQLLDYVK